MPITVARDDVAGGGRIDVDADVVRAGIVPGDHVALVGVLGPVDGIDSDPVAAGPIDDIDSVAIGAVAERGLAGGRGPQVVAGDDVAGVPVSAMMTPV